MDITQFAQSVAWIRVLETKLLNDNELERMILARNAKDAYKILNETDYSTHIGDTENLESFTDVINAGLKDTKDLIVKIVPYKWVFNILWFRYDFHNMKILLKAKHSKKSYDDVKQYLYSFAAVNPDVLKKYILDNENIGFGFEEKYEKYLKASVKLAEADFNKHNDPQLIDIVLDKRFCKVINEIALESGNEFLIKFTKKYIDLKNIELFIRLKIQKREEALLHKGFINRGYLEKFRFVDAYRKDISDFAESMRHTDYANIIRDAVKGYEDDMSFVKLDKLSYDHLNDYMQRAKRISLGPEPVFSYFWAKKNNALVVRSVMVGKLNNVEPEQIKKIIRNLY
ncbi:V-type ATPase subunit [Candidatus Peregrinibacteria bacterium]|nr:V-type ATPase subunit [Candidatus Peregrinibacteria bacterium]